MMSNSIINVENVVIDLYTIIDNIDTMGDMCKGDYEQFFKSTMREVKKREQYYEFFDHLMRMRCPNNNEGN